MVRYPQLRDGAWLTVEYVQKQRSTVELGRELGCTRATVGRALARAGIPRRLPPRYPELADPAYLHSEYVTECRPVLEIAREVGCSHGGVQHALARAGSIAGPLAGRGP
jgi:hypothetical protein